jgi:hypothetical protein
MPLERDISVRNSGADTGVEILIIQEVREIEWQMTNRKVQMTDRRWPARIETRKPVRGKPFCCRTRWNVTLPRHGLLNIIHLMWGLPQIVRSNRCFLHGVVPRSTQGTLEKVPALRYVREPNSGNMVTSLMLPSGASHQRPVGAPNQSKFSFHGAQERFLITGGMQSGYEPIFGPRRAPRFSACHLVCIGPGSWFISDRSQYLEFKRDLRRAAGPDGFSCDRLVHSNPP